MQVPYSLLTVFAIGDQGRLAKAAKHPGDYGTRTTEVKTFGMIPEGLNGFAQRGGEEASYGSQGIVCFRRDRAVKGFERRPPVLQTMSLEQVARSAIESGYGVSTIFMLSPGTGGHLPYTTHLDYLTYRVMVRELGER